MDDDIETEETHILNEFLDDDSADDIHDDEEMDSESELSQQTVEIPMNEERTSAWNCPRCTFDNTNSASICEMCGSLREERQGSTQATDAPSGDGKWECGACTLLNPRQAQVCAVCSTPNPSNMENHSRRGLNIASALGLFATEKHERHAPSPGLTGDELEVLANDNGASNKLTDTLQTLTHDLAMMEASSEGGFGLILGRPKIQRMKQDPKLLSILCAILKDSQRYKFETRVLACQSINYIIKMDIRLVDGKKAQEWMFMYLQIMDEMEHDDGTSKAIKQLAEEAANGLEVTCQSNPFAFRELCTPGPLTSLLSFISYAKTLHVNVLLTSMSLLLKVCQKFHFNEFKSRKMDSEAAPLSKIMATLTTAINHDSSRVHVITIKCMTILFHRTPLHYYISGDCVRQLLQIAVMKPSGDDGFDASRAVVVFLTEVIDELPLLLTTLIDPNVYGPLMQQLSGMLQTESVAVVALKFFTKVTNKIGSKAGGAAKPADVLHDYLLAFVKASSVSVVTSLIKDGASVHGTPSPLLVAVKESSLSMVRLLVRKGADVTGQALHIAAAAKRCDVVSFLLQHGASPSALNENGETLYQVLAKEPEHPVSKLLTALDGNESDERTQTMALTSTQHGILTDFSREWNEMDTEEDESENYDEEMNSDDEYHEVYEDEESHDDEDEDENELEDLVEEESKESDTNDMIVSDSNDVHMEPMMDISIQQIDAMQFTQTLFASLVHVVPSIDNKNVTHAILSTLANVLIYPIEMIQHDINVLLELIHGLLVDSNEPNDDEVDPSLLHLPSMVLALRLLHALSKVKNATLAVVHMERQGILDYLDGFITENHFTSSEQVLCKLFRNLLDELPRSKNLNERNAMVNQLNDYCIKLNQKNKIYLNYILESIENGITTYELTKSPIISTLLNLFLNNKIKWNSKIIILIRHLHQLIGLNENLSIINHGMPKGKEFYPLARQLRCRMRLISNKNIPPRSIHASPLTLYSSFEKTVFRCANINDKKWLQYAWCLVGEPIWKQIDGKWIEGIVCGFDQSTGSHLLYLKNEYIEEILQEENYRLVKTPMIIYSTIEIDMNIYGITPSLKRKKDDIHTTRRSKRIKKQENIIKKGDEIPKLKEKRILDLLEINDTNNKNPIEGDRIWISNGIDQICISGILIRKTTGHAEVQVSFSNQNNIPLIIEEKQLITFQAKARPGSSNSKVQRMLGALDSQSRGSGRPVLEHLRRLLSRSRSEMIHHDESNSTMDVSNEIKNITTNKKGKQKAKLIIKPILTKKNEIFRIHTPPQVKVLLGYCNFTERMDDQFQWLVKKNQLSEKAIIISKWFFESISNNIIPKIKINLNENKNELKCIWTFEQFNLFCKEIKFNFHSSELYILFSEYGSMELNKLNWSGFKLWMISIGNDIHLMKCFSIYLEKLGFLPNEFQNYNENEIKMMEFSPEDNLYYCLHSIHPKKNLGIMPWKTIYNVYCDFKIIWEEEKEIKKNELNENNFNFNKKFQECIELLGVLHEKYNNNYKKKEIWLNPRLSRKLRMQLQDVLAITSGTYPKWCDYLVNMYKFLFPFDMRYTLFRTSAFGFSRSLHWFRDHLDQESTNEELSITPLQKERAKVDRIDIIKSADAVMKAHSKRKAILDIVFLGERGYGSGVTAEFYSAVAHALQNNSELKLWVSGHEEIGEELIRHPNGLFPLPTVNASDAIQDRFRLMGRLAGKALLDERLLPLPLSSHMLKLVLGEEISIDDMETIFMEPGRTIKRLYDASMSIEEGNVNIMIENLPAEEWLNSVDLNFIDPITQNELVANGDIISVTIENLNKYVNLILKSWYKNGILLQINAFRDGLTEVISLNKLKLLYIYEIQDTLCGTDDVKWTNETLKNTIKLAHGYTVTSKPIEYLIETLIDMTIPQRRAFLLYATGCPNLPQGGVGFEKLKPQFEVVRRVIPEDQHVDTSLPFARTCTNTLHLPAYSTKEILKKQLEYAILNSKGVIDRD